jgi:hypothetical protein
MYVHVAVLKGAQVRGTNSSWRWRALRGRQADQAGPQAVATINMVYGDAPGRFGEDD